MLKPIPTASNMFNNTKTKIIENRFHGCQFVIKGFGHRLDIAFPQAIVCAFWIMPRHENEYPSSPIKKATGVEWKYKVDDSQM